MRKAGLERLLDAAISRALTVDMDDIVLRGMAKWPDVPAVYGWLTLDRRGNWLIKGEPIGNAAVVAFIGRNYDRDGRGRWFFQNGPQRVYVALGYTPFVYRAMQSARDTLTLEAHTGSSVSSLIGAWIDENGSMILETEYGIGIVHDHDLENMLSAFVDLNGNSLPEDSLESLMDLLQQGREAPLWLKYGASNIKVESLNSADAPQRFGFDPRPAGSADEIACA
jgi:hypothetical protein